MTPKEKAEELVNRSLNLKIDLTDSCWTRMKIGAAKHCALITVCSIMDAIDWHEYETPNKEIEYWEEVRQEIEKL